MSEDNVADFLLLDGHPSGGSAIYASADFKDADETTHSTYFEAFGGTNAVQGIVSQSLSRHISESIPIKSPGNPSTWRRRLRDMMLRQTESVLDFLARPSSEQSSLGAVEAILRKYSIRQEIDASSLKTLQQLLIDIPGSTVEIEKEIQTCIEKKGPSNLNEIRSQVNALVDMYKETGEKVLECENQLKLRIEKLDKLQRRVSVILELQTNDGTKELINSMEKYIEVSARDLNIEALYKQLIFLYQKHISLRDSIQVFKMGSCLPSEPLCTICLTDSIGYAIVPCGHTFCVNCSRKMLHECGICRTRIKERLKLYIS